MGEGVRIFFLLAAVVGGPLLALMVVPTLAKRFLKMSHGSREAPRADIAELDDMSRRIAELEERVDFAERLLAQQRDAALPRGKS